VARRPWWDGPAGAVDEPVSGWEAVADRAMARESFQSVDPGLADAHVAAATRYVWEATGRRFPGCVPAAARAPSPGCHGVPPLARARSHYGAGMHLTDGFAYPVRYVHRFAAVDAAGTISAWPTDRWWWDGDEWLWRDDSPGDSLWPAGWPVQVLSRRPGQRDTWWLECAVGADPPDLVVSAAADLAVELAKALTDPENCALPDNVQSITRRGVTVTFNQTAEITGVHTLTLAVATFPRFQFVGGRDPAHWVEWQDVTRVVSPFTACGSTTLTVGSVGGSAGVTL
jgi:hypothetical protein